MSHLNQWLIHHCVSLVYSIQTNYFPTMANVMREKSVFNLSSAQVACEPSEPKDNSLPLPERTSFVAPLPGSVIVPCKLLASLFTANQYLLDLYAHPRAHHILLSEWLLDSGFAFSSAEGNENHERREDHDIASLKVIQFHQEEKLRSGKLQSFDSSRSSALLSFEKHNVVVSDLTDATVECTDVKEIEQL